MTDAEDTQKKRVLLNAFRALERNRAFAEEFTPLIAEAHRAHLQGLAKRHATPEARAEFVEAYHFTEMLTGFCAKRIEELESELTQEHDDLREHSEGLS